MEYRIYLDDCRVPKSNDWVIVRSFDDFVTTIKSKGVPDEISFDHDLGWDNENDCETKSGYDCAKWLVENCVIVENFNVHSANPVGKKNIEMLLNNYNNYAAKNSSCLNP